MARIGVMLPRDLPAGQVLAYARRAEELGFDELWVVEDLGFRGGVAQAGAVLAATSRIVVGIGILPAGARNAAFAAMELATLAQLFPGRLIAGIGHGMPGWMRQVGARPASPLTLLREYTVAVRALLRGEPGPAAGRYVRVEGVVIGETPRVVPPVVLGVRGPKSLAVAGEVADGVLLAEPSAPPYVADSISRLAAPSPSPLVITYDAAVVGDDGPAARTLVRPGLAWIGEPDWAPHLAQLPFAADLARHRAAAPDRETFAATMPDEWVQELALAGTPDEVRARIAARHAAGATSVVLIPAEPDPFDALARLALALPGPAGPPADHAGEPFERACVLDSAGHADRAVPLYREALARGLSGYRRRRAVVQLSSSLRNIGELGAALELLEAERAVDPATLDAATRDLADAVAATLALCLADAGREREAVAVAVGALAPHLPRYQRSMATYARLLIAPE